MSRIGLQPIELPQGVAVGLTGQTVTVTGPNGQHRLTVPSLLNVKVTDGVVTITARGQGKTARSLHGLYRSLINNALSGVSRGFTKKLEMKGTGFRAELQGRNLLLNVGFSHPVTTAIPEGIAVSIDKGNVIVVSGHDRYLVGQFAAKIRAVKPPEPYKGKGIKYADEVIRRKPGKAAKAVAAA